MDDWQRERYLLHARSAGFERRLEEARRIIRQALACHDGVWAVSYSGGKDSTVVLDLCVEAGWRGPILWQSYGPVETLPGNRHMVQWARRHYGLEVVEHAAPGELEVYEEVGHVFIEPSTREERAAVRRWWDRSFRAMEALARERGWAGMFWGLRMEESSPRRMHLARRGPIYFVPERGLWTACPLWRWTGADVWAYLVSRALPWNPIYDAEGADRERLRNDVVFLNGGSVRHGQFAHWRRHAPALFRRLAERWPEIRRWT